MLKIWVHISHGTIFYFSFRCGSGTSIFIENVGFLEIGNVKCYISTIFRVRYYSDIVVRYVIWTSRRSENCYRLSASNGALVFTRSGCTYRANGVCRIQVLPPKASRALTNAFSSFKSEFLNLYNTYKIINTLNQNKIPVLTNKAFLLSEKGRDSTTVPESHVGKRPCYPWIELKAHQW